MLLFERTFECHSCLQSLATVQAGRSLLDELAIRWELARRKKAGLPDILDSISSMRACGFP